LRVLRWSNALIDMPTDIAGPPVEQSESVKILLFNIIFLSTLLSSFAFFVLVIFNTNSVLQMFFAVTRLLVISIMLTIMLISHHVVKWVLDVAEMPKLFIE